MDRFPACRVRRPASGMSAGRPAYRRRVSIGKITLVTFNFLLLTCALAHCGMERLAIHPVNPQGRYIDRAVEILKRGGLICYPTDTVYGIGCNIFIVQSLINRI